jgi:multidrug efflux pump subunit AcrA (membrane-fusion protein)
MRIVRNIVLVLILAGLAVAGQQWFMQRPQAQQTQPQPPRQRPAPLVRTAIVDKTQLIEQTTFPGEIRASATADIVSRMSGRLGALAIREGSTVTAGSVVARIIDPELELAVRQADAAVQVQRARLAQIKAAPRSPEVAQAQANVAQADAGVAQADVALAQARRELARTQQLFNDGLIARANVDRAQTDVERAQADVELARARVRAAKEQVALIQHGPRREDIDAQVAVVRQTEVQAEQARARVRETRITAPISGVITKLNVESGSVVSTQTTLATVATVRPVELHLPLPEGDLARLRNTSSVKFKVESLPERLFEGKVSRIAPSMDATSRTARLIVTVANADASLKPGMFARATMVFDEREAVVAPTDAIVRRGESTVVFVVKDDTVEERSVKIGYVDGSRSEVTEGLDAGESIVTVGQQGLRDGMKVRTGSGSGSARPGQQPAPAASPGQQPGPASSPRSSP